MTHSKHLLHEEFFSSLPTRTYLGSRPVSVVGIATTYGLDGPGIETHWGEIFRTCPDRSWGRQSLLYDGYRVFPEGKGRPGRDADTLSPSGAEVKNRVELYSP